MSSSGSKSVREVAAPYMEHMTAMWGGETEGVLRACELTLPHFLWPLVAGKMIGNSDDLATLRPLVVVVERTFTGANEAAKRVYNKLCERVGVKDVGMLFTGGDTGRQHYDECPALLMYENFSREQRAVRRDANISVDNLSMNTGTQALTVAHCLDVGNFRTIYLVAPYDHMTRNCAVMLEACRRRFSARQEQIVRVSIIPVCYGNPNDINASGLTMAREAFGSNVPEKREAKLAAAIRQRAGQYTERWKESIARSNDPTWPCGAATPAELIAHLHRQPFQLVTR